MNIALITSFFVLILDQMVKFWTVNHLDLYQVQRWIPNILDLHYLQNTGAGWGMFAGQRWFLIALTLLAIAYFAYLSWKNRHAPWIYQLIYGLIIGGALGNLVDRLLHGYVVDMFKLAFIDFPVFNLADAAISVGTALLIICLLFDKKGWNYF